MLLTLRVQFVAPSTTSSTSATAATITYLCADPWGGWDNAAASAACRMAGYVAGGEAVKVWRAGALPPLLLGRLTCEWFYVGTHS